MPDKHKSTQRWGGPGASHEDRTENPPAEQKGASNAPDHRDNRSAVSGGGGERDKHHSRDPAMKGDRKGN